MISKILLYFQIFGIDFKKLFLSIYGIFGYTSDFIRFRKMICNDKKTWGSISFYPIIDEKYSNSGTAKGHYFHQDLVVAQKIFLANPDLHLDVGSRVDGFVSHVASFRKIEVIDIRKPPQEVKNIKFLQHDLMKEPPEELLEHFDSLSCLHALEHFGLGRYGDKLDSDGHIKGFLNLYKLLKPGGILYLSVPIGPTRIEFNAHRVFSISYLFELINKNYVIKEFSYVDDIGNINKNVFLNEKLISSNCNCNYGCGIFELIKNV